MFIALFIAAVAVSLALFDAILNRQYRNHPDSWRLDGCPWGFFRFPRESEFLAGYRARNTIFRRWLFSTPSWAARDRQALFYLWLFRVTVAVGVLFWTIGVVHIVKQV